MRHTLMHCKIPTASRNDANSSCFQQSKAVELVGLLSHCSCSLEKTTLLKDLNTDMRFLQRSLHGFHVLLLLFPLLSHSWSLICINNCSALGGSYSVVHDYLHCFLWKSYLRKSIHGALRGSTVNSLELRSSKCKVRLWDCTASSD